MEHSGKRGFDFLKAFHPENAPAGLFAFDCVRCGKSFDSWETCFDSQHTCLKTINPTPLSVGPPVESDRLHKPSFVGVFPVHVEKKRANSIKYRRFWIEADLKKHNELNNESDAFTYVQDSAFLCTLCYKPYAQVQAFNRTCKIGHGEDNISSYYPIAVSEEEKQRGQCGLFVRGRNYR